MAPVKQLWLTASILIAAILFFGLSPTDIWVQSHFYNPLTHQWIIDPHNSVLKFIFYDGIKRLLILIAVLFLVCIDRCLEKAVDEIVSTGTHYCCFILDCCTACRWFFESQLLICRALKVWMFLTAAILVRVFGKNIIQKIVDLDKQKCWPAGHASGGFALLSLIFLFHSRKNKIVAGSAAMIIGWSMGNI